MNEEALPQNVTNRVIGYLNILNRMAKEGLQMISSRKLAERSGVRPSVVRNDLSLIGSMEIPGKEYSIYTLLEHLPKKLRLDRIWKVVIIGMGSFGYALVNDHRFAKNGIEVTFLFDNDPKIVGTKVGSYTVHHVDSIEEKLNGMGIKLAILTAQSASAQMIVDRMIRAGIRGIINYTQEYYEVPENVYVHHLDPLLHIQQMIPYLDVS
ncbi:MAG: redox-sensing transcriptional repressor Rex [Chloroflexota bacterium]|nr:redox-sensing transcriptional repressor Rex [Chloroflexota bacterium]